MKSKSIRHNRYILELGCDIEDWGIGISVAKSIVSNGRFYIYIQVLVFIVRIEFR
jgi:hypothetical protein